jgi:hypothetical protein
MKLLRNCETPCEMGVSKAGILLVPFDLRVHQAVDTGAGGRRSLHVTRGRIRRGSGGRGNRAFFILFPAVIVVFINVHLPRSPLGLIQGLGMGRRRMLHPRAVLRLVLLWCGTRGGRALVDEVLHLRWALRRWRRTLVNLRGTLRLHRRRSLMHGRSLRHRRGRSILLHRRRTLLHRRQMPLHWVRLLAMCGLGWVIAVIDVALLFGAAHFLNVSLLVDATLLVQTTLLFKASSLRRGPPIRVSGRRGRAAMSVVVHTGPGIFRGLLLDRLALLVGPVTHPLGRCRWRTTVMIPVHLGRHARVRRVRHAGFWTTVTRVFMMRRIVRLMLRVRRLRRRHAALMHADVVPRAGGAVQHRVGRIGTINNTRWWWWHSWRRASVVRVGHAFTRLRSWGSLRRLRLLHLRTAIVRRGRGRPATKWLRSVRLSKRSHLLLLPWTRLTRDRRGLPAERIPIGSSIGIWRLWWWVDVVDPSPTGGPRHRARRRTVWRLRLLGSRASPLRTRRSDSALVLICLRMHVGGHGRLRNLAIGTAVTQQLQPGLDMRVGWVEFSSTLVCIQRIADLVVARLILYDTC